MAELGARPDAADGLISGRYRLGELLGSGGSASVFTAVDVGEGTTVALKILHPHLSRSVSAREAFFGEARAAQALQHPNIVGVLAYGVHAPDAGGPGASAGTGGDTAGAGGDSAAPADDPQAWIALELVAGTSLAELVEQRGRLPIGEALAVADGVLSALEFAHAAGVVHRDVSPANVMLVRDPRGVLRPSGVRLVDFGLADAAGRAALGTDVLGRDGRADIPSSTESSPVESSWARAEASTVSSAESTTESSRVASAESSPVAGTVSSAESSPVAGTVSSADLTTESSRAASPEASAESSAEARPGVSSAASARRVGVVGNVNYLSPEQARGEPVDERGDLYQLGATLYFALVGRPPFVRSTRRAVMLAHLQAPPPVPSVLRPGLPRALDRLVVKALLKDPAQRFPDATRMRAAVRTAATHLAGADALPADDLARDGRAPGSGSPSALGGSGTMVLPAPSSYAGAAGSGRTAGTGRAAGAGRAAGTGSASVDGSGSAPGPDDTTQVLPTARSRRAAASHAAALAAGAPANAGARSTPAWSPASGAPAVGSTAANHPAASRTAANHPAASRTAASRAAANPAARGATNGSPTGGSASTPAPPRGPLARGALALWCGVGVVALLVIGAWALASGSVPPSSFAAGSEQTAAPTAEPTTTTTPATAATQPPTQAAAALVPVPVLQGSLAEARAALAAAGLTAGAVTLENAPRAADSVLSTSPAAGTTVAPGAVVDLTVASGSNAVPTVEGAAQDDAVTSIRTAGFDVVVTSRADAAPPGTVLQTLPAHGTVARLGSTVTIVVASPLPAATPDPTPTPTATAVPTPTSTATPPAPAPTPAAGPR
ncbi:protein kinase domain-containing protein [Herbiconiux sp. YIM B11900]|uniref:serine/threonine-protein kinase n=1 Tax=Herbiconiux sp. YIM B11900 TaxID=3404131 RepID=UPI003F828065